MNTSQNNPGNTWSAHNSPESSYSSFSDTTSSSNSSGLASSLSSFIPEGVVNSVSSAWDSSVEAVRSSASSAVDTVSHMSTTQKVLAAAGLAIGAGLISKSWTNH